MGKAEIEAAIANLEAWGRTVDNWVLICAAVVALSLTAEVVFSVMHWRNENRLRPIRTAQSQLHETELVTLQKDVETARQKNLELEDAVSPRVLEQFQSSNKLKSFSGTRYMLISPADTESRRTAGQVRVIMEQAGWVLYDGEWPPSPTFFADGIMIRTALPLPGSGENPNPHLFDAERLLADVLTEAGAEARPGVTLKGVPAGIIRIEVGLKPIKLKLPTLPGNLPGNIPPRSK
jgi:hypothetical protein